MSKDHDQHTNIAAAYNQRLRAHIWAVRDFGARIGVPKKQLDMHDASKWTTAEYWPYAHRFCGDGGNPAEFARAWLNHIHQNEHHWQHWIFPDGYEVEGAGLEYGVMRMPNNYALEMIADWHGAGYAYTGSWDISDWLAKNMPRIVVHSKTDVFLREQLDMLGYADIVNVQNFARIKRAQGVE